MRLGVAMESGSRPSLGQVILLGTSSMVTAVLYSIYRQKAQVAQELKVSAGGGLGSLVSLAARAGAHRGATGPQTTRSQRGSRAPAAARRPPPPVTLSVTGRYCSAVKLFLENLLGTR